MMSLEGSWCQAKGGVEAEEMPDEGGCDELGSRLEEELNRSIDKMREEEGVAARSPVAPEPDIPLARLISLNDSVISSERSSSSSSPHPDSGLSHSPLELLQDVEMPNCNISYSCSSSSPQQDSMVEGQRAIMENSTRDCLDTAVLISTNSSHSYDTNMSNSVFDKEHTASPLSFSELLQDIEMPAYNTSSCEPSTTTSSDSHHAASDGSGGVKTPPVAALMEDSGERPASHAHHRPNLKDHQAVALGVDNMNIKLFDLSPIKKMKPKETPCSVSPSQDSPKDLEMSKLGSDTLSSSGIMCEALMVLTELEKVSSNLTSSPDRRFTVHPLDMEGINDSLLSASLPYSCQKPPPNTSQHYTLPSTEGEDMPQHDKVVKKEDTIERMTKLLGFTSDLIKDDTCVTVNPTSAAQMENNTKCPSTLAELCATEHPLKEGNPAVNITFDSKAPVSNANPTVNITFDSKAPASNANPAVNTTYDYKLAEENDNPPINTTFDSKKTPATAENFDNTFVKEKGNPAANTTFDINNLLTGKGNAAANTTFDKPPVEDQRANTTIDYNADNEGNAVINTTFTPQAQDKKAELDVTFEKGEYKIGSLNETVNLMDAEENILQVILDATPKKISKHPPKASSTPKTSGNPLEPHLKARLMKSSPMNFLNRLLDGAKKEGQPEPTTTCVPAVLKPMDGAAGISQPRRQLNMRSGPMKALPLSMVVTNAAHLEANAGSENSGGSSSSIKGPLSQRKRITVPSFGSISSIESEMPSTPDCGINRNTSISSPEVFRMEVLSCNPCITSTPTFTGRGVFSAMMEMDGAIPTPIAQVSQKPFFSQLISSSSQPEGMSSGSLDKEGMCRKSTSVETKSKSLPDPPPSADTETLSQQPSLSHPKSVQVEDSGIKRSKESEEQQKPSTYPDVPQTTLPSSPQTSSPPPSPVQSPSPLPPPSSPLPPPPPPVQPSSPLPSPPAQPSLPLPPPSTSSSQPTSPATTQPSSTTTITAAAAQPLPLPLTTTTIAPVTQTSPPLTATTPQQSSTLPLPTQPSSPTPLPSTQPQMSSPPSTQTSPPVTTAVVSPAQLSPPPSPPLVRKENVTKTKPQKGTLVSPPSTKPSVPSAPGAAAKKDVKLKRPSSLLKPATHTIKKIHPRNTITDKENRRRSFTADSKQGLTRQPQIKTGKPSPLLSKQNPAPRLVLKSYNTNTNLIIDKLKVHNNVPASKNFPVKSNPQVETVGVTSSKDKCKPRKASPQPKSTLTRTLSGSKLPKTLNTSDSSDVSLKVPPSYSKKLPSPRRSQAPEAARKFGLMSTSGRAVPVTAPPSKPSSAPQIKASLPVRNVRNSMAPRQKPSLLKTPKPVL